MHEIFPSVKHLRIPYDKKLHPSIVEHHFPHLTELVDTIYDNNAIKLEHFLRLNPQICRLTIEKTDWGFLKMLSDILPQLEYLNVKRIDGEPTNGVNIHFENLKTFKLSFQYPRLAELPISFGDALQEIIDWTTENNLFDVILRNKNLKKVFIYGYGKNFERIADELPNLEEFSSGLELDSMDTVDQVVHFVETAKNLKKLGISSSWPKFENKVLEKLHGQWELIKYRNQNHIIFIRRESFDEGN